MPSLLVLSGGRFAIASQLSDFPHLVRSVEDVELDTSHFDHKTQLDIVTTRLTTILSPSYSEVISS